jgi:CheY-like chemotaxis protein
VTSSFEPLYVDGDPARLVQSLANVLTNAAKYTDPGGNVRIESRADGGWALVTIADDGAGIPPELVPRVFELFVQSQRTLDRSQGGLGIGLSVVKRLIEMHGGRVEASSDGVGHGARFDIRLPLSTDAAAHAQAPVAPAVPRRRILIVDDNTDVARSLAMLLELDDHEVDAVQSSQQALERAPIFRPDVVLLDIGLPDLDGYELAPRLRALPGMQHLRLVALTGYGQAEDRRRGQAAGFDAHLVKPVDVATLQRTLGRLGREASAERTSNG